MHPITRCPACATLFRLVPDQLRMANGWARCGQCSAVFDAKAHLVPTPPDTKTTPPANAPLDAALDTSFSAPPTTPALPATANPANADVGSLQEPPWAPPATSPATAAVPSAPSTNDFATAPFAADAPPPSMALEVRPVSFLQTPRPRKTWARVSLVFMSLVLAIGLVLQVLRHERDLLHTLEPRLKPWLSALCVPLRCTLSPLQRVDAIVVESATFTQTADLFRLNLTLKNTSNLALATPAVELTLTNTFNQAVLRRVFLPAELRLPAQGLAGQAEASASIAMTIATAQLPDPIAGYQLLVFYP